MSDLKAIEQALEVPAVPQSAVRPGQVAERVAHPFAVSRPTGPQELSLAATPTRNCLTIGTKFWRRERDSNRIPTPSRISKLRIQKTTWSPGIPRKPHSCH